MCDVMYGVVLLPLFLDSNLFLTGFFRGGPFDSRGVRHDFLLKIDCSANNEK